MSPRSRNGLTTAIFKLRKLSISLNTTDVGNNLSYALSPGSFSQWYLITIFRLSLSNNSRAS